MNDSADFTRRAMMAGGLACAGLPARAEAARPSRLAFDVWRNGHKIGQHNVIFNGGGRDFTVAIDAQMAVGLGPIVVFRYHHQATETWRGGQFADLRSHTVTNGRPEQVEAVRTPAGVVVRTLNGTHTLSAAAHPLTHWNPGVLETPLFNPQTGALMREKVSRQVGESPRQAGAPAIQATRYALAGDADITDWYDATSVWTALRARVKDGSYIDYRRVL
jgi:hypothetical protein